MLTQQRPCHDESIDSAKTREISRATLPLYIEGFFATFTENCAVVSVSNTFDMKKSFSLQIEKLTVNLQNLIIDTEHLVGQQPTP